MDWHGILYATLLAGLIGLVAYWGFRRFVRLDKEEALRRAARLAFKFWQIYSFKMPALLMDHQISQDELYEAGPVLRDLVVSEVRNPGLSKTLTRPHPELAKVDPLELAIRVRRKVREIQS